MEDELDRGARQKERDGRRGAPERASHTAPYGSGDQSPASDPGADAGPSNPSGSRVVNVCKHCMTPQSNLNVVCVGCGKPLERLDVEDEGYVGHTIADKYVIKNFIDKGGMGEVYLGVNPALEQRVAVKFLKRKFISDEAIAARFINEARSYARVSHPNAVTLLEYGQHDDGALYIITEFVDGLSLSKTIKKTGPFTPHQVISVGQQCCDVLVTAHKLGVIHRDGGRHHRAGSVHPWRFDGHG